MDKKRLKELAGIEESEVGQLLRRDDSTFGKLARQLVSAAIMENRTKEGARQACIDAVENLKGILIKKINRLFVEADMKPITEKMSYVEKNLSYPEAREAATRYVDSGYTMIYSDRTGSWYVVSEFPGIAPKNFLNTTSEEEAIGLERDREPVV